MDLWIVIVASIVIVAHFDYFVTNFIWYSNLLDSPSSCLPSSSIAQDIRHQVIQWGGNGS
jgi:hypothetical protein